MNPTLEGLPAAERGKLRAVSMPSHVAPMLATLAHETFSSDDWLYERKLDGVRCIVYRDADGARLLSRNDLRLDRTFPELGPAVEAGIAAEFIADGEIVAFDGNVTSFARLQKRLGVTDPEKARSRAVAVKLYLFDILYLDGYDTRQVALRHRKRILREAFNWQAKLRYTPHRNRDGEKWLAEVCRKGWEGLIAKRADARYVSARATDWLKFKCGAQQELVIGGYTDPQGSRVGFGALLLGYYEDGKLRYAGKVGTGFDDAQLDRLGRRLSRLEQSRSPFGGPPPSVTGAHFVKPELVAEVGFTEWTTAGKLRHPRFLGLRHDKAASEVRRE